jgi:dGTP triphosphohydrolase
VGTWPFGLQARNSALRVSPFGWNRAICDYLSGMTDRYTIQEHHRLFGLKI